jgi:transcriptional regulator with XRE-family HTH domain
VDVGDEDARPFYRRCGAEALNKHWMVWPDIGVVPNSIRQRPIPLAPPVTAQNIAEDFDLVALHAALDARRMELGLAWADVARDLGVSSSTLRGLGTRPRAEGDGVLRAVAWLGRSPESFVPGQRTASGTALLPSAARVLRFDVRALYAALDGERVARGLTWRDVALASGVGSAAGLTRLRAGGRVMFPEVMRMLAWLGAPAARFVREELS